MNTMIQQQSNKQLPVPLTNSTQTKKESTTTLTNVTRSPLRLIKTKQLTREEWLKIRQTGIGSSDAAAAVGLNPYQSQLFLWMDKTGKGDLLPQIDPDDDTHPVYCGNVLEPIVATHYSKKTGNKVRRVNAVLQHPDYPWMLANIDREIIGNPEVQILECKTAGIYGQKLWQNGVPEYVQLQVMHQLAVTGKQAADVAVLIAGQELRIYRIQRDEVLIEQLIKLEQQFWHWVQNNNPPPADGSDSAQTALTALFNKDNGQQLDLQFDADLNQIFEQLLSVRQALSELKKEEARYKQRIQQTMGNHTLATFLSGTVSWKTTADSYSLNSKALINDHPDLIQPYLSTKPGNRRFVILD